METEASTNLPLNAQRSVRPPAAMLAAALLAACASLTIQTPKNNDTVALPAATPVVITTGTSMSGLAVNVDGTDFSSQMTMISSSQAQGSLQLAAGSHTLTASAQVACSYCSTNPTALSATASFVVVPGACVVANLAVPVITLDQSVITVGQTPGHKEIGYQLKNGKGILLLVDDAPGLLATQMRIATDLDPVKGATSDKRIESWPACHTGNTPTARVSVTLAPGTNVSTDCAPLSAANNFTSGCTLTQAAVQIDQSTSAWLSIDEEEYIDESAWKAFGGRSLRFIWITN